MTPGTAPQDRRWSREWLAIGAGTLLLVLGTALVAAGEGFQVLPSDIAGRGDPGAWRWLLLAVVVLLAMPPVVAWLSGRRAWPLTGLAALVGGVAATLLVGSALPGVFDSASVTSTFAVGVSGGVALRYDDRAELAGRAAAVVVLVAASWLLTRAALFDPLPYLVLPALGLADWLSLRMRGRPTAAHR